MKQQLDFSATPRRETAERVLSIASTLFEAVKAAPLTARKTFPTVLRSNNFALAVRATPTHTFLEVTTKLRAHRNRELHRTQTYRQIFTSIDSGDKARLVRFGGGTLEAPRAFAIGSDMSMCAWDTKCITTQNDEKQSHEIDIIYVVGYGSSIREDDCWQEFDTLIRVTLSDWSGVQ
jgi:hypothetical protein